eukprot:5587836-Prymnesium_polylepis.1
MGVCARRGGGVRARHPRGASRRAWLGALRAAAHQHDREQRQGAEDCDGADVRVLSQVGGERRLRERRLAHAETGAHGGHDEAQNRRQPRASESDEHHRNAAEHAKAHDGAGNQQKRAHDDATAADGQQC